MSIPEPTTGKDNSEQFTAAGKNIQNNFSDAIVLSEHIYFIKDNEFKRIFLFSCPIRLFSIK